MMRAPHFVILAQIDPQHSISACRHGMVHLTWARITVRFVKDEFQRLAGLLQRAADNLPPSSVRDGNLWVTSRPDEDCEIRMGSLVLLLAPTEFHEFARLTQKAAKSLKRILASGMWDGQESESPPSFLEQIQQIRFSRN
jgi:hypothetical protein